LRRAAAAVCGPDTEVQAVTARSGVRAIEHPSDLEPAASATLDAFEHFGSDADAGIVACFSDPGLAAVRRAMPFPVVGLAEAACIAAAEGGRRFAIITLGSAMQSTLHNLVRTYGFMDQLAVIHYLSAGVLDFGAEPERYLPDLRELVERSIAENQADVLVLGGAVTAGVGELLSSVSPVPVLDGLTCAVHLAEQRAGAFRQ
jgi:allantoin racemase